MRFLLSIALLCVVSAVAGAAPPNDPLGVRLERVVDGAAEAALRDRRFSGVILIAKDGKTMVRKGYGLADRDKGLANTPETSFMIMSVSKQFTAALILRLAVQGRLSLNDRVSDYLTDWPLAWDDVTIRHLLTHTAGTEIDATYFWLIDHHPEYWPNPTEPKPPYEPRPLINAPGTAFLYSNVGFTLLSRIASAAGGRPFDELMRDEVFCPIGMDHTAPERVGPIAGRARGYHRTDEGLALSEQRTIDIVGAGDLVSTVDDLAKWDDVMTDDRFLPASIRSAMVTPSITGWVGDTGYGWFSRSASNGLRLEYHAGSGAGFRAWNYRVPELGLVMIVLSNVDEQDSTWVRALLDSLMNEVTKGST